jgi:hypothetical protein
VLVYWLLFAYFAIGATVEQPRDIRGQRPDFLLRFGGAVITVLIGFRYHVGGDWMPYEWMFDHAQYGTLANMPSIADPGYYAVNLFVRWVGADLWLVNLICGTIFSWGLIRFAEAQPRPWLAVTVAIPYLVIVVAMGYTRQAVSIGLIMAGLTSYLKSGSVLRFVGYVLLAATFHKTAVVALPLVALANERGRLVSILITVAMTYLLYSFFLSPSVDRFVNHYVGTRYSAQGAAIRVAMSVVPAVLFLLRSRTLGFTELERRVWRNLSVAALGFLVLLFVLPSSAVVDRLALYTIPLQLVVLSRPRSTFATEGLGKALVIAYAAAVQFTWLNFAVFARLWVPYRFWPFG